MRSTSSWFISLILCVGVLFMGFFPLGGAQAVRDWAALKDDQYFIVENVEAAEPVFHDWLRRAVIERKLFEPGSGRLHRIHRIAPGKGTVVGWRYAYDDVFAFDEERLVKLTLFLPGNLPQGETVVEFTILGEGGGFGVETRDSLVWRDTACMGIVREGTIHLVRNGLHDISAKLDLVIERTGANDVFPLDIICPTDGYRVEKRLTLIDYKDLTPWGGRAQGTVGDGEWWPDVTNRPIPPDP